QRHAAQVGGMVDNMVDQAEVAIDKIVPCPRLMVEATLQQRAVQSSEWHGSCPWVAEPDARNRIPPPGGCTGRGVARGMDRPLRIFYSVSCSQGRSVSPKKPSCLPVRAGYTPCTVPWQPWGHSLCCRVSASGLKERKSLHGLFRRSL